MASAEVERNKEVVRRFFDEVIAGRDLDALDALVAEDYVQHSPGIDQGRAGLRTFLEHLFQVMSDMGEVSAQLIGDGDLVVRQTILPTGMLIDIYRVRDGKLQEHWDAYRPNPGTERLPGF
jgi:predicted SnoaL-like aldol condensation-catalyzing enzyme